MKPVFFDTWGWIALADKSDEAHAVADILYREYIQTGLKPITTNYILAETLTLLRGRVPTYDFLKFVDMLYTSIQAGEVREEWITPEREAKALKLLRRYKDKPRISFFDLTSFVVMQELSLSDAFSGDPHFDRVGLRRLFYKQNGNWKARELDP